VQELNGATPVANLLTSLGVDEIFLRTDSAGTRSFLTDGLGSTMALADSTGTLVTQYTYDPFGKTTFTGTASTNAFKYTGREDDGTGLYYYRARYYHPALQRFITEDPIGFRSGDTNLYAYVKNTPINSVDPLGLFTEVMIWQPVGRGQSSFGHVSVNINGGTFSFGPHGMYTPTTAEFLNQNGFRNGVGMVLNLTPEQEHALEQSLIDYGRGYDFLRNNCADPIQQGLQGLGFNLGPNLTPADLGNALQNSGLVSGVNFYPKSR